MAIVILIAAALFSSAECAAGLSDPFPAGYGMAGLGAVCVDNGIGGREPWTPAAFYRDTLRFGISAAGVFYYDPMDNLADGTINRVSAGAWARFDRAFLTVKASYSRLNALGVYFEDAGTLSAATDALRLLNVGIDIVVYRAGITRGPSRTSVYLGESLWFPRRFVAVSFSALHAQLARRGDELDKPPVFRLGLHTRANRFGAQGAALELTLEQEPRLGFAVGEELRLHERLSVSASFASSPVRIGVGLNVMFPVWSAFGAFVYHPVLGWSKGFGAEWMK